MHTLIEFLVWTTVAAIQWVTVAAIPIDNGLIGQPTVTCGSTQITISFDVEKPFAGNLYTKGFYKKEECRLRGSNKETHIEMTVPVNFECGMRRKRVLTPSRGLVLEATVVLMFHPIFLTKIDKSYHVQCLYMEADKAVTQTLDVSTLQPDELAGEDQDVGNVNTMPTCQYEVLRGGPQGTPLKYATIGESVYHKWSCTGSQTELYCMTVHSCAADDGQGFGQQLLDQQGCSLDKFLLNNLDYPNDMQAGQEAHVFKFADRPTIFFGCQIRLELKEEMGGSCQRVPCSEPVDSGSGHPIETPSREGNQIENDFPRPNEPKQVKREQAQMVMPFPFTGNPNLLGETTQFSDQPFRDLRNFDKLVYRRIRNRSARDSKAKPFHVDMDVIGAVDVLDAPPENNLQPLTKEREEGEKICLPRSAAIVLLLCVLSTITTGVLLYCTITTRIRYAEEKEMNRKRKGHEVHKVVISPIVKRMNT